jgi:hypothetical protein
MIKSLEHITQGYAPITQDYAPIQKDWIWLKEETASKNSKRISHSELGEKLVEMSTALPKDISQIESVIIDRKTGRIVELYMNNFEIYRFDQKKSEFLRAYNI